MQKILISVAVAVSIVALCAGTALSGRTGKIDDDPGDIQVYIAPQTLVLDSPVAAITVHTDIAYSAVDLTSVDLDGVAPYLQKPDSCGRYVAKFRGAEVAEIVEPGAVTLTLAGMRKTGVPFSGSDTIQVR
jgi:hypothetical protein